MKITLLEVPLKLFLKRLKTAYLNDNVVKLGSSVDVPILTFAVIPSKILCHSNVFFFFVLTSWTQSEKEIQVLRKQKSQQSKTFEIASKFRISSIFP